MHTIFPSRIDTHRQSIWYLLHILFISLISSASSGIELFILVKRIFLPPQCKLNRRASEKLFEFWLESEFSAFQHDPHYLPKNLIYNYFQSSVLSFPRSWLWDNFIKPELAGSPVYRPWRLELPGRGRGSRAQVEEDNEPLHFLFHHRPHHHHRRHAAGEKGGQPSLETWGRSQLSSALLLLIFNCLLQGLIGVLYNQAACVLVDSVLFQLTVFFSVFGIAIHLYNRFNK